MCVWIGIVRRCATRLVVRGAVRGWNTCQGAGSDAAAVLTRPARSHPPERRTPDQNSPRPSPPLRPIRRWRTRTAAAPYPSLAANIPVCGSAPGGGSVRATPPSARPGAGRQEPGHDILVFRLRSPEDCARPAVVRKVGHVGKMCQGSGRNPSGLSAE
jgi:hypothetical protein